MVPNMLFNVSEWAVAYAEQDPARLKIHLAEIEKRDGRPDMLECIGIAFLIAWREKRWKARAELKRVADSEGIKLPNLERGANVEVSDKCDCLPGHPGHIIVHDVYGNALWRPCPNCNPKWKRERELQRAAKRAEPNEHLSRRAFVGRWRNGTIEPGKRSAFHQGAKQGPRDIVQTSQKEKNGTVENNFEKGADLD